MKTLVLLRHGESVWNMENRFTGWTDVGLSDRGHTEAQEAGLTLCQNGFVFSHAYTSVLKRAIHTLNIVLAEMQLDWIPVTKSWRLNERHYGALQGLNKAETAAQYGEEQVKIWRRSFDIRPPALALDDKRHPAMDMRYHTLPNSDLPAAESLSDTIKRFMPYWDNEIAPSIKRGERLLIAAHGNSLRALVKHLDNISDEDIAELNIPTGIPLVYELDDQLTALRHYYLGDEQKVAAAISSVSNQGKKR